MLAVSATAPDLGRGALVVAGLGAATLAALAGHAPSAPIAAGVALALLVTGTSVGAAIGSRIEKAGHLLPVALVSSLADLVSVLTPGAPSDVVADTPALLSVLAVGWPMPGTADVPAILGVGDVVFLALYAAAARRHGLSRARTLVALAVGLALTALVVGATSMALPALPFLGASFVVAHPEARRLPVEDRRAALVGIVVIGIALAALVLSRGAG